MGRLISRKVIYLAIIIFLLFPFTSFDSLIFRKHNLNYKISIKAFANDTPDVDLDELPDIDYDVLNELWYDPKIEMLIITPNGSQEFVDAVKPLMDWKNEKGVKTIILSNFSLYPGNDNATKIRNMIKSYHEKENIQWVLLCGDAQDDLIPIRYVYNPDVVEAGNSEYSSWDDYYKPTDFYYADLTGSWDDNGNGKWGESAEKTKDNIKKDEISWTPDVYLGRLPADNRDELEGMINKILKYEKDPMIGDWMGQMLLAGGISDAISDESRLTTYIWQYYTKFEMNFSHLLNSNPAYTPPGSYDVLNRVNFNSSLTSGYSSIIFAGHGNPTKYADEAISTIYNLNDAKNSNNINMPSLIYADACTTASFDQTNNGPSNDNNIGEVLIKRNNSGAIGYIGGLRVNWYLPDEIYLEELNRGNAKLFWKEFFQNKKFQQGKALYDSKVSYLNSDYFKRGEASINQEWERKNVLTYSLLGDPEVDIYTNKPLKVSNPFPRNIYEGQLVSSIIRDKNGKIIPYARVNLRTNDGKYRTEYADINGIVNFRVPAHANEIYNVTITGHNLIPSYFNFTTLSDGLDPDFLDEDCTPKEPTVSNNICFGVEVIDSQSGIETVYLLQSNDDDFDDYEYFEMSNSFKDDKEDYKYTIDKLKPGNYYFLILARDWANNIEILDENSFKISIPVPLMDYVLIITSLMIIGIVGISIFVIYKKNNEYTQILKRYQES